MLGPISARAYIIIALITAAALYAVQLVDRNEWMATFIETQAGNAQQVLPNSLVAGIAQPMIWAFTEPLGAIITGLFWPFALLWLLLFVVMQVFAFVAPGLSDVQDTYET